MTTNKTQNGLSIELEKAVSEAVIVLKEIIEQDSKLNKNIPVEFLKSANPKEAVKQFKNYQDRHKIFNPELVWEYSSIGNHYQALIFNEEETITVSVCPNYYIPWALRNATHPREHDFVVVDDYIVRVSDVMDVINEYLNDIRIREAIVNHTIIRYHLSKIPQEETELHLPTEIQIQRDFDHWRLKRGLATIDSYNEYLQANGLTHQKVEMQIIDNRKQDNFLESLCHSPIEDYYSEHKNEFIRYKMESYIAQSAEEAKELSEFLQTNPDGLCNWSRKQFLAAAENFQNNYQLNTCRHYQLDAEVAEMLAANPNTGLLPPIEMNGKLTFVNILEITPSSLDQQTESIIRQRQITEWINEKKKTCSIQWLWGDKDIFPNQNIQEV